MVLRGEIPVDMLKTDSGAGEVKDLLNSIAYGGAL